MVEEGTLDCSECGNWFRIEKGILDLLPFDLRRWRRHEEFAQKYSLKYEDHSRPADKAKLEQIDFFAFDSVKYEDEITNSPCFSALDETTFIEWLHRNVARRSRVLDLGCGTGRQCVRMAEKGYRIVGVDISEEMVRVAKKNIESLGIDENADFVLADAEHLPLVDESFDACIAVGTLHHVPKPDSVVLEASRKIVKGGGFFFHDPHDSPVRFIFDFLMRVWKLYDEHGSNDPLMKERNMRLWLSAACIDCTIRMSVYVPPHFFNFFSSSTNQAILRTTDRIINKIPIVKRFGGILVTEGVKRGPSTMDLT
jgi:ubiquinone/menaquinone biosynthesis C-methylase UbiE